MAGDFLTRWTTVCCPVAWNELRSGVSLLCTECTRCGPSFMLPAIMLAHWWISSFWYYFQGSFFNWSQATCCDIFIHFTLHYYVASYIQNLSFSQRVLTPCRMVFGHHFNCGNIFKIFVPPLDCTASWPGRPQYESHRLIQRCLTSPYSSKSFL